MSGLADPHGNATSTGSRAALEASENALWRMLSFYGTPLDDLDVAIAADPAWLLPRLMKAGFLLNLTEPSLVAEATRRPRRRRAARRRRERARARPPRGPAPGRARRLAGRVRRLGRPAAGAARATSWPCSGRCCSTSTAATPRRCASASPRCCRHGARPIRSTPTCSATMPSASRSRAATPRPRPSAAGPWRANGARAVGDPRRRPRHGDAGPACRRRRLDGDLAAVLGRGQRLRRPPRLARGAVRARVARPCEGARGVRPLPERRGERDHAAAASTPPRCSGGWRCTAPTSATAGSASSPAGRSADPAAAGGSAFNDVHALIALLGAGERSAAARWMSAALAQRRPRGGPWNREVSRIVAAPLMQGLRRLRRRPLRRRRPAARGRCAAPPAHASAAAMRSAT